MNTAVLLFCAHEPHELRPQVARGHLVERGERLVAQQQLGLDRERARDRDALAHAAGERVRIVVLVARQARAVRASRAPPARPCRASASRICRPSMTLASAVRHGISRSFWNTMPILPRKKSKSRNGSWPITSTLPEVGSISPAIRLNMVDLPQPVLPSTATISPLAMSSDSLSTARRSPDRRDGGTSWSRRQSGSRVRPGAHRITSPVRRRRDSAAPSSRPPRSSAAR